MSTGAHIRAFRPADAKPLWHLLHQAVHRSNAGFYSLEQLNAWAPHQPDLKTWQARFARPQTWVLAQGSHLMGFAELRQQGEIDCFYLHPDYQQQGWGKQLYQHLEQQARHQQLQALQVYVSLSAQGFFARLGFHYLRPAHAQRNGIVLPHCLMRKTLA